VLLLGGLVACGAFGCGVPLSCAIRRALAPPGVSVRFVRGAVADLG
jgi:hypothetical protein